MTAADQTLKRFRKFCLAFPETSEVGSWGHPNFRAGKRTFAAFEWIKGRPAIAIRLNAEETGALLLQGNRFFEPPNGRGLWVAAWADQPIDWKDTQALIERSYREVALKRMLAVLDDKDRK
jgi:predicted DNA-binding protein (MmcQ/YjbR family)